MPKRPEAEQAGTLVWGRIASQTAEAIAPLLLVRMLSQAEVGIYAAVMLLYSTVAVLLTTGFPGSVLYFLAGREPAARRAIVLRMTLLMTGLGAATALLLFAMGTWGQSALEVAGDWLVTTLGSSDRSSSPVSTSLPFLTSLAVYAILDFPTRLLPNILIAEKRARVAAMAGIVKSISVVVFTITPAALGFGVPGVLAGLVVAAASYAIFYVGWVHALYRGAGSAATRVSTKELVWFSFPLGLTEVAASLNSKVDLWLIVLLFSTEQVAAYKMGAWQIPIITTVAYSLGAVYLPRFAELYKADRAREAIALWRNSIKKVSLIVVPTTAVFVVAAEEFVTLVFTEEYIAAAPVFRCYALLTMARVSAFGNLIVAAGRPSNVLRAAAFTLVANAAISVPLVLTVGFLGPALGTTIAFVPTVLIYCVYIARASRVRLTETFPLMAYLRVVAVAAPGCALAVLLKDSFAFHPGLMLGFEAVLILGGFAALGTFLRLIEREDWQLALDWARLKVLRSG